MGRFNPLQLSLSISVLGFLVFCLSFSMVLSRHSDNLVNSMTISSVPKLPKIA